MGSKAADQCKLKVWLVSCLCLTMLGCGSKDDDNEKNSNSDGGLFLNIGHFTRPYPRLNNVVKADIQDNILVNPIYRMTTAGEPEIEDENANELENNSCYITEDRIEATSDYSVKMFYKSDTRNCLGDNANETRQQEHSSIRVYSEVTCTETKIGVLHGSRAQTKIFEDLCPNDSKQLSIRNYQKIRNPVDAKTDKTFSIIINNATMSSDGGLCETNKSGKEISTPDCGEYYTQSFGSEKTKYVVELHRYEGKNLVGTVGDRYYSEGQFEVMINNWVGVLKYGSLGIEGSSQPPIFDFRDTTSGGKLEGSIVVREEPKAKLPSTGNPISSPAPSEEEEEEEPIVIRSLPPA